MVLQLLIVVLAGIVPPQPGEAGAASDPCLGEPLTLRWTDLLTMGDTMKKIVRPDCQVRLDANSRLGPTYLMRPTVAGRWKLGSFKLAGEEVGYGFDMIWGPEEAFHGRLDGYAGPHAGLEELRLVPQLYLPERWDRAIDTATYPALIVGGAAVGTWVIIEMIRAAQHAPHYAPHR